MRHITLKFFSLLSKKNKKIKRSFSVFRFPLKYFINFLLAISLFGSASYAVYAVWDKVTTNESVISEQEIVLRIKNHLEIPNYKPQSVARVENASTLRLQNDFFKDVKDGDYVILYNNMAIIYDLKKDEVLVFRRSSNI